MASLGNSIINGRLRVINETNTGALTVNGSSVSLLSGNIKDNTSSTAVVSAKQVADYITGIAGTITNNTSGGTSTATINAGKQIKIGAGYYASDLYYTAAANPTLSGNAGTGDVLSGKTFYNNSYTKQTGTMPNNGAVTGSVGYGGSYTIPAGYHNGSGKVTCSVGAGTIDVTDLEITPNALSGTWDSTNSKYVVSQASKTATMQSTVTTAGYVSSSVGTKNTGTATVKAPTSLSISKASFSSSNGTATLTVSESTTAISGATNISGSVAAPTTTKPSSGYIYAFNVSSTGTGSISTTSSGAGYMPASTSAGSVTVSKSATTYYATVTAGSITANKPTASVTNGAVTPSIGGTVTNVATTTKPSGTDGTDYLTLNPGGSITTQPKVTPTYKYSATAGYISTVSETTKNGDATNVSPSIADGTNYYLPKKTPAFDGGGISGGGLTATTNYSGTPTVTVASGSDTNMTNITVGSKAQSGYPYYFKVSGSTAKLTGSTTVTRAKTTRAAVLYNGAVNGWVNIANDTAASPAAEMASTTCSPTVTVNAASGSTYVGIKAAVITNGFVTGAGYMPDDDTAAYKTQYNATDDCVDILFN